MNTRHVKKKDGFIGERMYVLPTESFQSFAEDTLVRRLFLTDIGFFPHALHHYRERREGIEECILIYCSAGEGTIYVDGRRFPLDANEVFVIPANRPHRYFTSEENPWSIHWVHFSGEDLPLYPIEDLLTIRLSSANAVNRMIYHFGLLFRVLEVNYTLGNFRYISSVLALILNEVYNREKRSAGLEQNRHVTAIIRYMYRNLDKNLSLQDLSEAFELSKSYLNTIFQDCTQHSPIGFYSTIKMKEACKLLRTSDMFIYEIAELLGYKDQYYFSRIFKRIVGQSPRDYRNAESVCFEE